MLETNRDLAALRRLEETLREAQHKLAATLHGMADAAVVFDRDWRYTLVKKAT